MLKYKNIFFEFIFILLSINNLTKSQIITNIIWIGDEGFSYVNFANYSNCDIIVETTSNQSPKRIFYGLKSNGEYFFNKNGKSTLFYSINSGLNNNPLYSKNESKFLHLK